MNARKHDVLKTLNYTVTKLQKNSDGCYWLPVGPDIFSQWTVSVWMLMICYAVLLVYARRPTAVD